MPLLLVLLRRSALADVSWTQGGGLARGKNTYLAPQCPHSPLSLHAGYHLLQRQSGAKQTENGHSNQSAEDCARDWEREPMGGVADADTTLRPFAGAKGTSEDGIEPEPWRCGVPIGSLIRRREAKMHHRPLDDTRGVGAVPFEIGGGVSFREGTVGVSGSSALMGSVDVTDFVDSGAFLDCFRRR